jgi:hypothetical protein
LRPSERFKEGCYAQILASFRPPKPGRYARGLVEHGEQALVKTLELDRFRAHILGVADGWNIITRRPDPAGGPDLQGAFVVRVSDRRTAIGLIQNQMPDTVVQIDSETSPEVFEKYDIKPGQVFVLVEGK